MEKLDLETLKSKNILIISTDPYLIDTIVENENHVKCYTNLQELETWIQERENALKISKIQPEPLCIYFPKGLANIPLSGTIRKLFMNGKHYFISCIVCDKYATNIPLFFEYVFADVFHNKETMMKSYYIHFYDSNLFADFQEFESAVSKGQARKEILVYNRQWNHVYRFQSFYKRKKLLFHR